MFEEKLASIRICVIESDTIRISLSVVRSCAKQRQREQLPAHVLVSTGHYRFLLPMATTQCLTANLRGIRHKEKVDGGLYNALVF